MPKGKEGFEKGDPNINRNGRPIGSLNKKKKIRWNNLQDLAEWAQETLAEIDNPKVVLDYIQHKEDLLFGKMSSVPATPAESVENVKDAQSELEEASSNENTEPGSNPASLGESVPKIQA